MQRHEYQQGTTPSTEIKWAFLYGDCEHEVKKVHKGSRITIAYDIYTVPEARVKQPKNQSQSDRIHKVLQEALADHQGFAKDGCVLAFGLSHSYPKTTESSLWNGLEARLKGPDAVLLQAVKRCKLTYKFKAAFQREQYSYEDYGDEAKELGIAKQDELSDTVLNATYRNGLKRFEVSCSYS
jgi:hypothetical protein